MEKEEALFKNTSKLDINEIALFQKFAMKKTNFIVAIGFALIFIAIGVGISFIELTFGIITIVCGLLGGFVLLPYLMNENLKKQNAQNNDGKKYLNTFDFCEDFIDITTESANADSNEYKEVANHKLFYEDVYQAVLYKEHIYLYISSNQSFIVDYRGMTKGTIAEVIDFLKAKAVKVVDKIGK